MAYGTVTRISTLRLGLTATLTGIILLEAPLRLSPYTVWAIGGVVLVWCGSPFHHGLRLALAAASADSDMLISISLWGAFVFSTAAVFLNELLPAAFRQHQLGPMAALVVCSLAGRWLESRLTARGGEALGRLLRRLPHAARLVRDGRESVSPSKDVRVGDRVRVLSGELIPFDGTVCAGSSSVDESLWTGYEAAVEKTVGSRVYGGTQNKGGTLTVEVGQVGPGMTLSKLVASVLEGLDAKETGAGSADRLAQGYVPAIVIVAVGVAVLWSWKGPEPRVWHAFTALTLVLAGSCPLAFTAAAPAALAAGMRRAARRGIRIRNPGHLQRMKVPDVVILSKKGVLTAGMPEVAEVLASDGWSEGELLRWAAAAESRSGHPFAHAVRRRVGEAPLPALESVETSPGRGLVSLVAGRRVVVGSLQFLADQGVETSRFAEGRLEGKHHPLAGVAVDGEMAGVVLFTEPLREGSEDKIRMLERLGIEVVLASGDRAPAVRRAAQIAGIGKIFADVLEEGKTRLVAQFRAAGRTVAMVGDGVHDAVAMSRADLGMALAPLRAEDDEPGRRHRAAFDLSAEVADIVLSKRDLASLVYGIQLSIRIRRTVRENLMWAFAFHLPLVPIAAGALFVSTGASYGPLYPLAATALGVVAITVNSIRRLKQ